MDENYLVVEVCIKVSTSRAIWEFLYIYAEGVM